MGIADTIMNVASLPADAKIKVVDILGSPTLSGGWNSPCYPDCDWDDCGADNGPYRECPNDGLWFWVEVVEEVPARVVAAGTEREYVIEATTYTESFCLACAVREGHLTETEIREFDATAWRHYEADVEAFGEKGRVP